MVRKIANHTTSSRFLLVIHGGLVCYLILHNILMPLVHNIGSQQNLFENIHYSFFFQLILFALFFSYNFKLRPPSFIPYYIYFIILLNLYRTILFILALQKYQISSEHFSSFIDIASNFVFFGIYFTYFRHRIPRKKISLAIMLPLQLSLAFSCAYLISQTEISTFKEKAVVIHEGKTQALRQFAGCQGSERKFTLPNREGPKNEIQIVDCGFEVNFLSHNGELSLSNQTSKKIHLTIKDWKKGDLVHLDFFLLKPLEIKKLDFSQSQKGLSLLYSDNNLWLGTLAVFDINRPLNGSFVLTGKKIEKQK